jgi:hypothetical protein
LKHQSTDDKVTMAYWSYNTFSITMETQQM